MKSYSEVQSTSVAAIHSNKSLLVKGKQPLKNFSFYLDITNSQISRKLEEQIKELGGSLKFFLTKEVTHFITDKAIRDLNGGVSIKSPQTPISILGKFSGSNDSLKVTNEIKGTPKSKSRADAMLNRALQGTAEFTPKSPIQFAKELGTSVWHTTYAFKFLKKVYADKSYSNSKKAAHCYTDKQATELKNNFIKIESIAKGYRPYYQILKQLDWPVLQLRNKKNSSTNKKNNQQELNKSNSNGMTRKSRSSKHLSFKRNTKSNSSEKQCGFCELCKVEYDTLTTHLKSKDHCSFVKNESNYALLDSIINTTSNVNDFLNHSSTLKDMFPIKKIEINQPQSLLENNLTSVRQTRQSTTRQIECQANKNCQASGNCRLSDGKIDSADEINCNINTNDVCNKAYKSSRKGVLSRKSKIDDSPPLRHSIPKSLIYKVIEPKESDSKQFTKTQSNEENITPAIIVKIRKIRQTELSILNGEAESFMFPKRMSSDTITDEDRHTTSEINRRSSSSISSDGLINVSDHVNLSVTKNDAKRKRRTNRTSGSDGSMSAKAKRRVNLDKSTDDEDEDEGMVEGESNPTCADILGSERLVESQFAFERIPHYESWYKAFQRQDNIKEQTFEYYGNTVYRKLPYEMGPKTMDSSTYCKLCCKKEPPSESHVNSPCSTHDELKKLLFDSNNAKIKIETDENPTTTVTEDVNEKPSKARLYKEAIMNFDAPRKSPREHASTLAILSCLMKQRSEPNPNQKEKIPSIKGDIRKRKIKAEEEILSSVDNAEVKLPKIEYVPEISETVKCLRRGQSSKIKKEEITPIRKCSTKSKRTPNNKTKPLLQLVSKDNNSQPEKQYNSVMKQEKEVDSFLLSSISIDEDNLMPMSVIDHSTLDLDNEFANHIDLIDIIEGDHFDCFDRTGSSRYRYYKLFSVNKKRKNNKTGWPKKKRTLTQQRKCRNINFKDFNGVDYDNLTKNNFQQISSISPLPSSKNKFYDNFKYNEDDNEISCFTPSVCEKLETSGIFNVSSDSMDTLETECQMNDQTPNNFTDNKRRPDSRISMNSEHEYDRSNNWNELKTEKEMSFNHSHSLQAKRKKSALQIPNRTKLKSPCQNNEDMTSPTTVSPRKLRKPRGCLYRER